VIRHYDVVYFMASVDKPEDNKAFAEKEHADFVMLSDPDKKVADAYGVLSPPNPDRPTQERLARRWTYYIGPDGRILAIDKAPGTANAGDNLIAKLKELGIKEKH
jgi:thioredoxin-dependent peroxiredoxin